MKARHSYLRSMTDGATGSTLPVLRPPAAPLWPVRSVGMESFAESVAPATVSPQRTRMSDPVEPITNAVAEPFSLSPPAHAATGRTASTRSVRRAEPALNPAQMGGENREQLQPVPMALSEIGTPHQELLAQETPHAPHRSGPQADVNRAAMRSGSMTQPGIPHSAAPLRGNPSLGDAVVPSEKSPVHRAYRASRPTSVTSDISERPERNTPPRPASATRIQLEPPPIADRIIAEPAATGAAQFAYSREQGGAQPQNTVHIGKIDIHITPPPAPVVPRRTMRQMPANSGAALARGFLSSFGLRQG